MVLGDLLFVEGGFGCSSGGLVGGDWWVEFFWHGVFLFWGIIWEILQQKVLS